MTLGLNWKNSNIGINKDVLANELNRAKAAASKRKNCDRKAKKMHFAWQTKALSILEKPQATWRVVDYKALCVWKRQKDDAGVTGMNLEQLKVEWERHKNRQVSTVHEPPEMDDDDEEDRDDDDEHDNDKDNKDDNDEDDDDNFHNFI